MTSLTTELGLQYQAWSLSLFSYLLVTLSLCLLRTALSPMVLGSLHFPKQQLKETFPVIDTRDFLSLWILRAALSPKRNNFIQTIYIHNTHINEFLNSYFILLFHVYRCLPAFNCTMWCGVGCFTFVMPFILFIYFFAGGTIQLLNKSHRILFFLINARS